MPSIWRKGRDSLRNGTILGATLAGAIWFGEHIKYFVANYFPKDLMYLGDYSVAIYFIVLGAVLGYVSDRF